MADDQSTHPTTTLDVLSPRGASLLRGTDAGGYTRFVVKGETPAAARQLLDGVRAADLLAVPVADADDAGAMLAALWLWHDALEPAHQIVQDLASPTGSFWHAILHRREGDFSNARYWYARCAGHKVNRMLGAVTASIIGPAAASDRMLGHLAANEWDGSTFIDLAGAVMDRPADPRYPIAVALQQAEWHALFQHCVLAAAGMPSGE